MDDEKITMTLKMGDFITELLTDCEMTVEDLSVETGLTNTDLALIVQGEKKIDQEISELFGKVFKHSPNHWLELQNEIDEAAIIQVPKTLRDIQIDWD